MIHYVGAVGGGGPFDGDDQAAAFTGMQFHPREPPQRQGYLRGPFGVSHQEDATDVIFVHLSAYGDGILVVADALVTRLLFAHHQQIDPGQIRKIAIGIALTIISLYLLSQGSQGLCVVLISGRDPLLIRGAADV